MDTIRINSKIIAVTTHPPDEESDIYYNHDRIDVLTADGVLTIVINTAHQCCESFGYFDGKELDEALNMRGTLQRVEFVKEGGIPIVDEDDDSVYASDRSRNTMFIRFVTDTDTIVVAVYNEHNGYYGHEIACSWPNSEASPIWDTVLFV